MLNHGIKWDEIEQAEKKKLKYLCCEERTKMLNIKGGMMMEMLMIVMTMMMV